MGRARVPARREGVPSFQTHFNRSIDKHARLRKRRIARTRSLPALGPPAAWAAATGSSTGPIDGSAFQRRCHLYPQVDCSKELRWYHDLRASLPHGRHHCSYRL
jgi:hypothetical protein